MAHKAKRLAKGEYEYRGWHIYQPERGKRWLCTKSGCRSFSGHSLTIAKALVDSREAAH